MAPPENRLGRSTSPYLRQHRLDPVDWYPWGDEAIGAARELDRPLFLSIGYSACHWCHVMAHESFSDDATARQMNDAVVAVKVDREERPDVDSVYMEAVLAANGHGGWPMSVFATPDGRPFFAGTYFPSEPRHQMPSFRQVLSAVADAWATRRGEVEAQADALAEAVRTRVAPPRSILSIDGAEGAPFFDRRAVLGAVASACERLAEMADPERGGFGTAPKFPQPLFLELLMRAHASGVATTGRKPLDVALQALEEMASGGIYDHLGGGFSRYSVDREWLVPHFEKMLYDQALLSRCYLHAWQITGDPRWRQMLDEVLGYVLGVLHHRSGALMSAEDADSEGEEGKFYLWDLDELREILGGEAREVASWYGVTAEGNFEGRNILHRPEVGDLTRPEPIESARRLLEEARSKRVRPGLDDKVLTEWNAMACSVLAEAAAVTGDERYRKTAVEIMAVLLEAAKRNGRVPRLPLGAGDETSTGFAPDVAWLCEAAVRLYELTGESRYLAEARLLVEELFDGFVDEATGTVFTTRADAPALVARPVELFDGVVPSAASVAAVGAARLAILLGDEGLASRAAGIASASFDVLARAPLAMPEMLLAADLVAGGGIEIAATGSATELLFDARRRYLPTAVYAWRAPGDPDAPPVALLDGREGDAVHVCLRGACRLPATTLEAIESEIDAVLRGLAPVEQ